MALICIAFILRALFGALTELLPEEAYYWNYSRHLDIGYLDHPPMVAWLICAGRAIFGDTEIGVRFGALCCGLLAGLFVYRLTRNVFGTAGALLALALMQIFPYFFLSGLLMTPDAPLCAAWAATLYFLERALFGGLPRAWLWAGLTMGLGLLSKYTIALLGVAALVFMLIDPPSRRWFRRWEPYAALAIAAVVFAPVVVWNAEHGWASFAFQTSRRLAEAPRFTLQRLLGGAVVLLTPIGFAAVVGALVGGRRLAQDAAVRRPWRLLQLAAGLPLAVFAVFSLRHEVKLDWTGAPFTAALPATAFWLAAARAGDSVPRRWLRASLPVTAIAMLMVYGAGLCYLSIGLPGVRYSAHTELLPVGWRNLADQVDAIAARSAAIGDDLLVVGMDRYSIASELAFYGRDHAASVAHTASDHLFGGVGLMYELWFPAALQTGRTLLLVSWDAADLATDRLAGHVDELEPLRQSDVEQRGATVRTFYYRIARGYRPTGVN